MSSYDSLQEVFVDDLTSYLKDNMNILLEDYEEMKLLKVFNAYDSEREKPLPPEIDILVIDESENQQSNSFMEGENLTNIVLQFYCYGKSMKVKGSDEKLNAIIVTRKLAGFVTSLFKKNKIVSNNKNIISVRKTTQTNVMQVRDQSLYYCILRYEFELTNDYKKKYRK